MPSLNIDLSAELISFEGTSGASQKILEVMVRVQNISRVSCTIPAVYVHARALATTAGERLRGQTDMKQLTDCGGPSEIFNAAFQPNAIFELGPDEVENFVRWDTVDSKFIEDNKVIVFGAYVFAAPTNEIGALHFPRLRPGKLRSAWIEFMAEDDGARNREVVFSIYDPNVHGYIKGFTPYEKVLTLPGSGGVIDEKNTRHFSRLLRKTLQWFRYCTLNVSEKISQSPPRQPG